MAKRLGSGIVLGLRPVEVNKVPLTIPESSMEVIPMTMFPVPFLEVPNPLTALPNGEPARPLQIR